jgi:hypothetical protein
LGEAHTASETQRGGADGPAWRCLLPAHTAECSRCVSAPRLAHAAWLEKAHADEKHAPPISCSRPPPVAEEAAWLLKGSSKGNRSGAFGRFSRRWQQRHARLLFQRCVSLTRAHVAAPVQARSSCALCWRTRLSGRPRRRARPQQSRRPLLETVSWPLRFAAATCRRCARAT